MAKQRAKVVSRRRWAWAALACLLSAGCVKDYLARLRGPGFDESSHRLTSEFPQREEAGRPHSFSTKAREIEQNFGYR